MADGWGGSWGSWHTSNAIPQECPQGCPRRHTVEEAVKLNEKHREYVRAKLHENHRRWLDK